jgi:hypothetical protein
LQQQHGSPEPVIAYVLLSPNHGLTQENGALYTVINGIKTRVIDAPEDIASPQHPASTPGSQPLSRQQLQQLQYETVATPNVTRPQNWSSSSLEDNLDNLQLDSDEATASIPAPARVTPNVTTRSMARSAASNSQLNSIETAEVNATHQSRPPQNSRGRSEDRPRPQATDANRRYPSNSRDRNYQNSDSRTSRRDPSYSRPSSSRNNSWSSRRQDSRDRRPDSRGRHPDNRDSHYDSRENRRSSRNDRDSRSYSRGRSQEDRYRDNGGRRGRRSYSREKRPFRSPSRSPSPFSKATGEHRRTQPSSVADEARRKHKWLKEMYPRMERGRNCAAHYDPMREKRYSKCSYGGRIHHEFDCREYAEYSEKRCSNCNLYNHRAEDCREVAKFPPAISEANTTTVSTNSKN